MLLFQKKTKTKTTEWNNKSKLWIVMLKNDCECSGSHRLVENTFWVDLKSKRHGHFVLDGRDPEVVGFDGWIKDKLVDDRRAFGGGSEYLTDQGLFVVQVLE